MLEAKWIRPSLQVSAGSVCVCIIEEEASSRTEELKLSSTWLTWQTRTIKLNAQLPPSSDFMRFRRPPIQLTNFALKRQQRPQLRRQLQQQQPPTKHLPGWHLSQPASGSAALVARSTLIGVLSAIASLLCLTLALGKSSSHARSISLIMGCTWMTLSR